MAAGTAQRNNYNLPQYDFVLQVCADDIGRGRPAVGKLVWRADLGAFQICVDEDPDAGVPGGGTWIVAGFDAGDARVWSDYTAAWGANGGNGPAKIGGAFETVPAWGLPLLNTLILLTSSVTVTIAHHALRAGHRGRILLFLGLTVLLGATFLYFQAHEYIEAYHELNLTLGSGVYGSTFFMLTGFHGLHVTLGTIMLAVIWLRVLKGHFSKDHHFGFEAVAWYWHFVDVVWLGLFMFVYIL